MSKKKILFIGSLPPPYHGVNIQNQRLLRSKLIYEFEIIHLDTSDKRDLSNLGKVDIINLYIAIKNFIQCVIHLILKRPHLVYLTISQNNIAFIRDSTFVLAAKIISHAKIIVHFRGSNYLNFYNSSGKLFRKLIDFIYSSTDFCIVLGQNLKSMVSKWFNDRQILILPNATDFCPDITQRTNLSNNGFLKLGYIGHFGPEKGTRELIESFKIIHDNNQNVLLQLAGDFKHNNCEFIKWFECYLTSNKINDTIKLLGNISGNLKERFFLSTDIFIFPSYHEGHPNAILEAMAGGCPIIATNVGAISESVIDGVNGFLIPPKSVRDIVEKVNVLMNNPQLMRQMGEKSRGLYEKHFTSEASVEQMISMFNNILDSSD